MPAPMIFYPGAYKSMMDPKLLNEAALSDCVDTATVITFAGLELEVLIFHPPAAVCVDSKIKW
jgi:hypothetical protein